MPLNSSSVQSLRRVFHESFSAYDIAESLISLDHATPATDLLPFMTERKLEVVGVRRGGVVVGYVERSELADGVCGDQMRAFHPSQVVLDSMPLADVVLRLNEFPRLFVSIFGGVGGIVTRSDLQKPPVRMWLFGMITLIEMRLTRMIEEGGSELEWKEFLSEGRLAKAEELMAERVRRNQDLGLLDCLQFSDKCQIVARSKPLRERTRYSSRRRLEDDAKKLQRLRNNLAHTQDIITTDWEIVVKLSEDLDSLVESDRGNHATAAMVDGEAVKMDESSFEKRASPGGGDASPSGRS
jgi:hypothetical protein